MPFDVAWEEERQALTTRTWGSLSVQEVASFVERLERVLAALASDSAFVWLSDASGYEAFADRAGHQQLREVLPRALAAHGFRSSLLNLSEGAELAITSRRGVICRAVAHVHDDAAKMAALQEHLGSAAEAYFSDVERAREWLAEVQRSAPEPA